MGDYILMKVVSKGLEVRLYPDEDIMQVLEQNIGNARFNWNKLLDEYQKTYSLFKQHGYTTLKMQYDNIQHHAKHAEKRIRLFKIV